VISRQSPALDEHMIAREQLLAATQQVAGTDVVAVVAIERGKERRAVDEQAQRSRSS
jgi:hypothetical protein